MTNKELAEVLDRLARGEDPETIAKETGMTPEENVIELEMPEIEDIQLGEFCVECRDPVDERTDKFASRRPEVREQGNTRLRGYLCEECQPLDGTLMEPIVQALKGRRWDDKTVRERMRTIGMEELYEHVVGPMLDEMEMLLRLER